MFVRNFSSLREGVSRRSNPYSILTRLLRVARNDGLVLSLLFALVACVGGGGSELPPKKVMIGKPYEVNGQTYYPAPVPSGGYDETGDGSWYGPGFNGKKTASGERFNQDDITAAHPTLPMPSLVLVTNLKNGKQVVARINDRGPFRSSRIIDLSKKTAQLIGLKVTQPVRVQYLKKETDAYIAALMAGDTSKMDMAGINRKYLENPADKQEEVQVAEEVAPAKTEKFSIIKEAKADDELPPQTHILKLPEEKVKTIDNKYYILAGSFSSEQNAQKLAKKISNTGKVSVEKIKVKGKNNLLKPFATSRQNPVEAPLQAAIQRAFGTLHLLKHA